MFSSRLANSYAYCRKLSIITSRKLLWDRKAVRACFSDLYQNRFIKSKRGLFVIYICLSLTSARALRAIRFDSNLLAFLLNCTVCHCLCWTSPRLYSPTTKYSFPKYSSFPKLCVSAALFTLSYLPYFHTALTIYEFHTPSLSLLPSSPSSGSLAVTHMHTRGLSFTFNQKYTSTNWVHVCARALKEYRSPSHTVLAAFCNDMFQPEYIL